MKKIVAVSIACVLVGALAACSPGDTEGGGGETGSTPENLVGTTVMWYSSASEPLNAAVVDAFEALYPEITVEVFRASTGDLVPRFEAEANAGEVVADVMTLSNPAFFPANVDKGWFTDLTTADVPSLGVYPDEAFRADGQSVVSLVSLQEICYNTDLVDAADAPTSLEGVLDPKYKGKITMNQYGISNSMTEFINLVNATMDDPEGYLADLAAQDPVFLDAAAGVQAVGAGEYAIRIPCFRAELTELMAAGAPVGFSSFDPTVVSVQSSGATVDGPNVEGGLFFLDYLQSPDGQAAFSDGQSASMNPDSTETLPLPQVVAASDPADQARYDELAAILQG